jgi:hypothetical protein
VAKDAKEDKSHVLTIKGLVLADKASDLAIHDEAVAGQVKLDKVIQECDDAIKIGVDGGDCYRIWLGPSSSRFS